METLVIPSGFGASQGETAVNPDFDSAQMETLVVPGAAVAQSDAAVTPDFTTEQAETIVTPSVGAGQDLGQELDISANEEVATKLDLAKAYEEMGDLEGARELLQEVLKEGDAGQRETAQALLVKISG
jgi:pilus assembly protein FimV